jgi:hypothetical protein
MRAVNAMVIDFKSAGEPGTGAEFTYHITPDDLDYRQRPVSVGKDLEAVLRKIEYWASSPCHQIQDHGPAGPGHLARRPVGRQSGNDFCLE